jgi:ABC-type transporter Mla subunit MlaD
MQTETTRNQLSQLSQLSHQLSQLSHQLSQLSHQLSQWLSQ